MGIGYNRAADLGKPQSIISLTGVKNMKVAFLQTEGGAVRWRDDDADPTPTEGHPLEAGDSFLYDLSRIAKLRFVAASPGAVLHITLYG